MDWLNRPWPKGSCGMAAFFKSIDTILWGPKTIGEGIPLAARVVELTLLSSKGFPDGVARLHDTVARKPAARKRGKV